MLSHHGSEEQQERYLRKMVSGEWTGTMNLTEPEAGSDVGALRTRAVPAEDGTWRITGTKIFITYGDHDLTDNIVHLVLARVPDAPPGTRGISCFIVPKFLVGEDGSLGERNAVTCASIEHKMGIHASPTCVLAYDDAVGYLIGEANAGMRYMFTMMNNARLSVGLEGLAVAEVAYQQALGYARERRQRVGRRRAAGHIESDRRPRRRPPDADDHAGHGRGHARPAVPARVGGRPPAPFRRRGRAGRPTRAGRSAHPGVEGVVHRTWGWTLACIATQVHGGMGYIEETGVAQYERDIRIAAIYEGTNGIQAIDLVGRKLPMGAGAVVDGFLRRMEGLDSDLADAGEDLAGIRASLAAALVALRRGHHSGSLPTPMTPTTFWPPPPRISRMFGVTVGGWVLARQALAARRLGVSEPFLAAKATTARFYCEELLPQAGGLLAAVTAGGDILFEIPADAL